MSTAQQSRRRRVALVGAGVIGRHHGQVLTQLSDRLELVAVVDPHADRAQQIVDSHGGRAYPSLAEAFAGAGVDLTFVGAEHMIYVTPCENQPWMSDHPAGVYFCADAVWDKEHALDLIHHFSTAFLLDTLKGDQAAHAALLPDAVAFTGIEYTTTMQ